MYTLILATVIILLVIAAIYMYMSVDKATSAAMGEMAGGNGYEVDVRNPPMSKRLYVESSREQYPNSGKYWPDPLSAGCSGTLNYGLLTPLCKPGTHDNLVNGGSMKCTNKANNKWSGCVQAKKPITL